MLKILQEVSSLVWTAIILTTICLPPVEAQASDDDVINNIKMHLIASLNNIERDRLVPNKNIDVRDCSNGAFTALFIKGDSQEALSLLQPVFASQDINSGVLPWNLPGSEPVHDENAIEFGTQSWGPLLLSYGDKLSEPLRSGLISHGRAALKELARHNPLVSYTNIYLMNAVNTLLIAQALNEQQYVNVAHEKLKVWWDYTMANGLHEFDSPTYYAVDLDALILGYKFANNSADRDFFKKALDFFWTDIAANTLGGRLIGPHSRDYDFIGSGDPEIAVYLAAEGLASLNAKADLNQQRVYALLNFTPGGYRVPKEILSLAAQPQRWITSRWGDQTGQTRFVWVSQNTTIGSIGGGDYCPHDKLFTIDLPHAEGRHINICFIPSVNDNPYGDMFRDKYGHLQRRHPPLCPVMVQWQGWVLGSLDIDTSHDQDATAFSTSLIMPADANEITLDDYLFQGAVTRVRQTPMLAVRAGDACAVVRILQADTVAPPYLVQDAEGLRKGVVRLVFPQNVASRHCRILFLARAGKCGANGLKSFADEVARARVKIDQIGNSLRAAAEIGNHRLELMRDLNDRNQFFTSIDGSPVKTFPLVISNQ